MTQPAYEADGHRSWCATDIHEDLDRCQSVPVEIGSCLVWLEQGNLDEEPVVVVGTPEYGAELTLEQADRLREVLAAAQQRARAVRPATAPGATPSPAWRALAGLLAGAAVAAATAEVVIRALTGDGSALHS